jgi:hypothetical protein
VFTFIITTVFFVLVRQLEKQHKKTIEEQKSNYGFDDSHFKEQKVIIKDLNYIVNLYLVISIWGVINASVTLSNAFR